MCSDKGREDGTSEGICTTDAGYVRIAHQAWATEATPSSPPFPSKTRPPPPLPRRRDTARTRRFQTYGLFNLTVDSVLPKPAHQHPHRLRLQRYGHDLVLNANEGTVVADGLQVAAKVTLSADSTDAVSADLYVGQPRSPATTPSP